jgi:hypothetical protein
MRTTGRAVGVRVGSGVDVGIEVFVRAIVYVGTGVDVTEAGIPGLQDARSKEMRKVVVKVLFIQPQCACDGNLV